MNSYKDCADFIGKIEKKFPVNEWKIEDLDLWPYIRTELAYFFSSKQSGVSKTKLRSKKRSSSETSWFFLRNQKRRLTAFFYAIKRKDLNLFLTVGSNPFFSEKKDVVYLAQASTVVELNKKWYNIFFDPINELLRKKGMKSLAFEFPNGVGIKEPKWFNSYLDLKKVLDAEPFIRNYFTEPLPVKLSNYAKFISYLDDSVGEFPESLLRNNIELTANRLYYTSLFFQAILKQLSPRIIILTCYYFDLGFALCHAAQKSGIKTIDMQHGVLESWPAYSNWTVIPASGYSTLPDVFWTWTASDAEYINRWAIKTSKHKAFDYGNTWFLSWKNETSRIYGVLNLPYDLFNEYTKHYSRIILFTGQPFPGEPPIPEYLIQTCGISPGDWLWLIRIHPSQTDQIAQVKKAFNMEKPLENVIINDATLLPLPFILKYVSIHITAESAAVIDAASMGIPSLITSNKGTELFRGYLAEGLVTYCPPFSETIVKAISNLQSEKEVIAEQKERSLEFVLNLLNL